MRHALALQGFTFSFDLSLVIALPTFRSAEVPTVPSLAEVVASVMPSSLLSTLARSAATLRRHNQLSASASDLLSPAARRVRPLPPIVGS
jgi:hypothetical protein